MTPTAEMIAMAERIGRNTNLSDIFAEARRRMIGDVTQMGIDHHIATVAGERAVLTAIMEVSAWKPMSDAPKDGTPILAVVAINDSRHLGHLAGRIFSIKHEGITAGGYDMGWAVYPGFGGCPDEYFAGWLPCPVPPSATGSI